MKKMIMRKQVLALATATLMLGSTLAPAFAHSTRYYNNYDRYRRPQQTQYTQKALIGGGAGALLGGLLASEGNRSSGAVKGALLGAGAGLGYEFLKQRGVISPNRW